MTTLMVSNVALMTFAIGALATAVELAKSSNYIGAGIVLVIAVVALVGYEKLPPTTPSL